MSRTLPIRPGTALTVSSVTGVTHAGQMRRDFLGYVERERAHPYRTFLHYNSWYDIGYFSKFMRPTALAAIAAFGTELHQKRGVTLDSFLFDDGWDDPKTLWHFNAGFPNGFANVASATHRNTALLPASGCRHGVDTVSHTNSGYVRKSAGIRDKRGWLCAIRSRVLQALPRHVRRHDSPLRRQSVQVRWDGQLVQHLSREPVRQRLRRRDSSDRRAAGEKPDLYVNLTTGTYPSPFWLRYADSIWRGGEDHEFAGIGSSRQRWITYRDADTYEHVVRAGALYPLNSLMLHGMIYARSAHNLMTDPGNDFSSEVRSTSAPARNCRRCTSRHRCSRRTTGTRSPSARGGRAPMPTRSLIRTGLAEIRCGWSRTAGRRGRPGKEFSRCGIRATSRRRSRSTSSAPSSCLPAHRADIPRAARGRATAGAHRSLFPPAKKERFASRRSRC